MVPLLVSPDLDTHSGALFDRKGFAVEPAPKLRDRVDAFLRESEALVSRILGPATDRA